MVVFESVSVPGGGGGYGEQEGSTEAISCCLKDYGENSRPFANTIPVSAFI